MNNLDPTKLSETCYYCGVVIKEGDKSFLNASSNHRACSEKCIQKNSENTGEPHRIYGDDGETLSMSQTQTFQLNLQSDQVKIITMSLAAGAEMLYAEGEEPKAIITVNVMKEIQAQLEAQKGDDSNGNL